MVLLRVFAEKFERLEGRVKALRELRGFGWAESVLGAGRGGRSLRRTVWISGRSHRIPPDFLQFAIEGMLITWQ